MCLEQHPEDTKKFRKRYKGKKEVVVWKVYTVDCESNVRSPIYHANQVVKYGSIVSNRRSKNTYYHTGAIYAGIHVFLSRKSARQYAADMPRGNCKVFKCTAIPFDLVAVGYYDQAVFMRIHISKEEFEKGKKGRN